jgi:hypothetical protein
MSYLMAFVEPSSILCHTATRVRIHGRRSLPGLQSGLRGWLIGAKVASVGEPFDASPAFFPAGRVDRPCPPSGRERFAPRADRHDRAASFPFDDYADLRAEGLLGLCVPERYGGLAAHYETYCAVAEQLAQGNASTALTFNMHCLTMLMMPHARVCANPGDPRGPVARHFVSAICHTKT